MADTGIGMTPEESAKLYTEFMRIKNGGDVQDPWAVAWDCPQCGSWPSSTAATPRSRARKGQGSIFRLSRSAMPTREKGRPPGPGGRLRDPGTPPGGPRDRARRGPTNKLQQAKKKKKKKKKKKRGPTRQLIRGPRSLAQGSWGADVH